LPPGEGGGLILGERCDQGEEKREALFFGYSVRRSRPQFRAQKDKKAEEKGGKRLEISRVKGGDVYIKARGDQESNKGSLTFAQGQRNQKRGEDPLKKKKEDLVEEGEKKKIVCGETTIGEKKKEHDVEERQCLFTIRNRVFALKKKAIKKLNIGTAKFKGEGESEGLNPSAAQSSGKRSLGYYNVIVLDAKKEREKHNTDEVEKGTGLR